MKLYYTTTAGINQQQNKNYLSLGGYKSLTQIPNNRVNNLFGNITPTTVKNAEQYQYIALIIENDTESSLTDLEIYFDYPENCYSILEVAAVDLSEDIDGNLYMENVQDIYTQPYNADFHEADGDTNAVSIGTLEAGELVGIWLRRKVNTTIIDSDYEDMITKNGDIYEQTALGTKDDIDIVFSWT